MNTSDCPLSGSHASPTSGQCTEGVNAQLLPAEAADNGMSTPCSRTVHSQHASKAATSDISPRVARGMRRQKATARLHQVCLGLQKPDVDGFTYEHVHNQQMVAGQRACYEFKLPLAFVKARSTLVVHRSILTQRVDGSRLL